jgi:hypothetical protein
MDPVSRCAVCNGAQKQRTGYVNWERGLYREEHRIISAGLMGNFILAVDNGLMRILSLEGTSSRYSKYRRTVSNPAH